MEMTPGELVDRFTVAKLYVERMDSPEHQAEFARLGLGMAGEEIKHRKLPWHDLKELMHQINGFIWDFESPIHMGKLDVDPIMAGILALRVRKLNAMRVNLSKLIDKLVTK